MEVSDENKTTFSNILGGVIVALIAGGVLGIWNLSASVSRLDERVSLWTRIYEARFERLDQAFQDFRRKSEKTP